jgi:predicted CXXCH cytochrome family protein
MLSNATYNLYADPDGTMDATVGQPAGVSKLCLGCHDGTVGKSSYGSVTNATDYLTGTKSLGTDLRDDHPLSFTYNAALATADGGLVTPANGKVSGLPLYGALSDQLECASCHNAHDNTYTKFLRASNDSSALCLKCHTK